MSGTTDPWAGFEEVAPSPVARQGGGGGSAATDPWAGFEEVSAKPRERSLGEEATRGLGRAVRAGVQGYLGVGGLLVDAVRYPFHEAGVALGVENGPFRSTAEGLSGAMDRLGLARPEGTLENLIDAGAGGIAGGVGPAAAARTVAQGAPRLGEAIMGAFSGATVPNALLGASAGAAGQAAASAAPEGWEGIAGTVGALGGVGGPLAAAAGAQAAGRAVGRYLEPVGIGRRNALSPDLPPVTSGQMRQAVDRLDAAATDPAAVRAAVAEPIPELVPGSRPTTFQATEDPGLGVLERGLSRGPSQEAFTTRAAEQRAAQRAAVEGLAPEGAEVTAPGRTLRERLAALDAANEAEVTRAQGAVQTGLDAAGGVRAGEDGASALQGYGERLRAPAAEAQGRARTRERQLWNEIDPDGSLVANVRPVRDAATALMREMPQNARPLEGEVGALFSLARGLPDAQPFAELTALRSRITDATAILRRAGDAQGVRQLSRLLDGVHDALDSAATRGAGNASPVPQLAASGPSPAPSTGSAVFTPAGRRVDVHYRLAEADDLVASHDRDMRPNPAFPAELQPRDRTRAASDAQVQRIAQDLQPERLGASASAMEGAPIIGADGVVESGNARVLGVRRAYEANGPQAAAYREFLQAQGYDPSGFRRPVLVRERTTPLEGAERARFTEEANSNPGLAMSATERAVQDAGRLDDKVLGLWRGGDVSDPANRSFARAFLGATGDAGAVGSFASADGALSIEGARRIRDALTAKAYGDAPFVAAMAEGGDASLRPFGGAMQDAAGSLSRVQAAIARGDLARDVDLGPSLVEAARIIQGARRAGTPLSEALGQADAFARRDPVAERLVRLAYGEGTSGARMSRERFGEVLNAYSENAMIGAGQASMFGDSLRANDILEGAIARLARENDKAASPLSAANDGAAARPSLGEAGDTPRRPDADAERRGAAIGDAGQRSVIEAAPLTPNFDAAAAERYATARAATRERYATFRNAPGVGSMLKEGRFSGEFALPESRVPSQIFTSGAGAAERVRAYLAAGGSADEVADFAAYTMRQAAQAPDGTISARSYQTWTRRYGEALSALPEVRERFENLGSATRALEDATERATRETQAFERSAAARFLGDADPVSAMGNLLRANDGAAQMRQLVGLTRGDEAARAGLQRAVVDYVLRDLTSTTRAAGAEATGLRPDAFQRLLRRSEPALGELFSPAQVEGIRRISADLQRMNLDTRAPGGGSDTAQNLAAQQKAGGQVGSIIERARRFAPFGTAGGLGFLFYGWEAASVGAVAYAVHGARMAGLRSVDDLVVRAMLDPEVARVLYSKVTARNQDSTLRALGERLVRVARIGAVVPQEDRPARRAALPGPSNALFMPGAVRASTPRPNALMRAG